MRSNPNRIQLARSGGLPAGRAQLLCGFCLALAVLILIVQPAFACSCAPPPSPEEALSTSAAVFAGKVTHIRQLRKQNRLEVTLHVYQSWKGEVKSEIVVLTNDNEAICGFYFEKDREYLVYARQADDGLVVSLCSRTKPLTQAGEDLNALKEGVTPPAETVISPLNRLLGSWGGVIAIGVGIGVLYILLMLIRSRILRFTARQNLPVESEETKER